MARAQGKGWIALTELFRCICAVPYNNIYYTNRAKFNLVFEELR
jgi:hypothetical protein